MIYQYEHIGVPEYLTIEKNNNFSFPMHLHQCFEIIILLSGSMNVEIDGQTYLLCEKEAVIIFPNQLHSLSSSTSQHILCIFSPEIIHSYAVKVLEKIPCDNKFIPDEYLIRALENLQNSASPIEQKGVLYSLCSQFDKYATYAKREADKQSVLHKIFNFVETNFSGNCSLRNLSEEIGYDYYYLSRIFKKQVGISFNSYVNNYRISHACYLLQNTTLPILQCSLESGFTSLRSFNQNFKAQLKITPNQYRKT